MPSSYQSNDPLPLHEEPDRSSRGILPLSLRFLSRGTSNNASESATSSPYSGSSSQPPPPPHKGGTHGGRNRRVQLLMTLVIVSFVLGTIWLTQAHLPTKYQSSSPFVVKTATTTPTQPTATTTTTTTCPDANDPHSVESLRASSTLAGLTQAAVASDHPVCSQLGSDIILKQGGHAVDAAVAVALCLGVANPASSGLGGGAFLLIHADEVDDENADDEGDTAASSNRYLPPYTDARRATDERLHSINGKVTEVIDGREIAPAAANTTMYQGLDILASTRGGLSIGVPGELPALALAHARHGTLPWKDVVDPVYQLAQQGVPVNENLAHEINILHNRYHLHEPDAFPALRHLLSPQYDSWEHVLKEGDILRNPALAEVLKAVRDRGVAALYQGKRAQVWASDIQKAGGIVTAADIEAYRPTLRSPVFAHNVQGLSLVGVPPPSSGGAAIIGAARFLQGFDEPLALDADTVSIHRLVEAEKHAFAIRMSISDPAYHTETVQAAVDDLTRGDYMQDLCELYVDTDNDDVLPLSQYGGTKWSQLNDWDGKELVEDANEGDRRRRRLDGRRFGNLNDNGTSHFSIVDKDGNAVSMTTSVRWLLVGW